MTSTSLRTTFGWLLAAVLPALGWSAYVYLSRMTRIFSPSSDITALALAVLLGLLGVLMLTRAGSTRWLALAGYAVVASPAMYFGMRASLCWLGDCP